MSNRRNALLFCLIALFATNAIAQDPEPLPLPSRDLDRALTPDEKERVLRGGVLTLFGNRLPGLTPDQRTQFVKDVVYTSASYLRWLGYPWTNVALKAEPRDYPKIWDDYFASFAALRLELHKEGSVAYAELAIPELVTEEVNQIDLSTPENKDIATFIKNRTGVELPARFDFTKIRQDQPQYGAKAKPDYVWSCRFKEPATCETDYVKNGIPSPHKPQGVAWLLYLAARAIRGVPGEPNDGADAIYLVPSRDLASDRPWQEFAQLVAHIRAMKRNIIIGSQGLHAFPAPPAGIVPKNQVDFIKSFIDVDIYKVEGDRRTVAPSHLDTGRVPCYLLAPSATDMFLPDNGNENICIVKNLHGRRPAQLTQDHYVGDDVLENNRYELPVLLEYDSTNSDCDQVYKPNPEAPNLTASSPCRQEIRHGLTPSGIFPASIDDVRHKYIQYSMRLGRRLSCKACPPVYVFGMLDYGELVQIRAAWLKARNNAEWASQKKLFRMTPRNAADQVGVLDPIAVPPGFPPELYVASAANGDLQQLRSVIRFVRGPASAE